MKKRRFNWPAFMGWIGFVGWFVLLWYLSSTPAKQMPRLELPHADKLIHFLYFGIGGATLAWSFAASFRFPRKISFRASLLVMAFLGAFDEWRQTYTPGRHGDFWDFVADVAGAAVGIAIALWVYERVRKHFT